jgi:hypothetical protein
MQGNPCAGKIAEQSQAKDSTAWLVLLPGICIITQHHTNEDLHRQATASRAAPPSALCDLTLFGRGSCSRTTSNNVFQQLLLLLQPSPAAAAAASRASTSAAISCCCHW